jgi:hypothetical protein
MKPPHFISVSDKTIPLIIRENTLARRLTLRWNPETAEAIVTVPLRHSRYQIAEFVEKSKNWLEKQMMKSYTKLPYCDGMILPILGKSYELRHKPSKICRTWWEVDHVLIHAPIEKFSLYVQKSLHQVASQFLTQRTQGYAAQLNKDVNRITLRDTRSRWGSCSGRGNISYSWRLVFAPEQVADYVCVHEVAHLVEMNHSSQFWKIVANFCPDYKHHRLWLRKNGKDLFMFGR